MTSCNVNKFRPGLKIIFDGDPYAIIQNEFVKPGKGQAFNRTRMRNLISGKVMDKVFKSSDSVELADVIEIRLTYLYNDSKIWYFINNKNFEQITADAKSIASSDKWLIEQVEYTVTLWNGRPISITPPNFVELQIIKTDPGLKGDTTGSGYKFAVLATGAVVKVPLFIQPGDVIKVDTRTGVYITRVKQGTLS